ncbi:ABC transporter ATP-binding protein [Marinobacterium sp. 3-1745]|uniref:ABC transporter ATP-binding protein n=2 Tax=Marinobacterium marinum TaxID=2756129 RepID=A0A7W2AD66_9GAMM|nr:ABC transporter ATP-binding protein [Marinobacterium marinum]
MDPVLQGQDLHLNYAGVPVISGLDIRIPRGQLSVILGANGCGKSSVLKVLSQVLPPDQGNVLLDGRCLAAMGNKERARQLALLVQKPELPDGISVQELVSRGRYPHQSVWRQWSPEDEAAVAEALKATGLSEMARREVACLSGGQQQRVWLALVLAQQSEVLLLDEPTSFLDIRAQLSVLDFCRALRRQGRTLVLVLHDINQALRYADHLLLMRDGQLLAQGRPDVVINEEVLKAVFDLDARIMQDPEAGCPMLIPRMNSQTHTGAALPAWE